MDINNAASSRADFYDRGADGVHIGYEGNAIAPHGSTVRATYTVPANSKVIINAAQLYLMRATAPAGAGIYNAWLQYTPSGGSAVPIVKAYHKSPTQYTNINVLLSSGFVMYPGDKLELVTADISAGGTISYILHVMMSEFDF